jgi:3-oxoacyl-[acyl-carrier protein] reductase
MKQVALVTGGSRGIGLGVAIELAKSGFDVVINGRRGADEVADSIKAIEACGAKVLYCRADVSSLEDHKSMLESIRASFGRLDALVNNAGVAPDVRADILEAGPASFDRLIHINLRGPYFLTQLAANWMIQQRKTHEKPLTIVNVSSISATVVSVNRGDYCISKAGVGMATQLWAARLAEFGINVFEVRPGVIATDMTAGVKEKYDKLFAEGIALEKRWGKPEEIGRAVAVLCRGELTYATGQVLTIDGGLTQRRL